MILICGRILRRGFYFLCDLPERLMNSSLLIGLNSSEMICVNCSHGAETGRARRLELLYTQLLVRSVVCVCVCVCGVAGI